MPEQTPFDELAVTVVPGKYPRELFDALWKDDGRMELGTVDGKSGFAFVHTGYVRRSRAEAALPFLEAIDLDGWVLHLSKDMGIWTALIGPYKGEAGNLLDAVSAAILDARKEQTP